ncbi:hypothetical protein C3Y87_14365 [Carbonactinospora thermoautotrophica]|uniref:WD40/YVTN/BNR-like repeat-containing protein n=1 Tax=Carbonactinospora thermoautotrophica TaxID=1469144 RepID=UPI00226DEDF5|nr:sialidase family protein [Carbonactinospora thermoautotrophica]MCX9192578.1 hypothetical protein [Carbonactinospora thermoautotrophica]
MAESTGPGGMYPNAPSQVPGQPYGAGYVQPGIHTGDGPQHRLSGAGADRDSGWSGLGAGQPKRRPKWPWIAAGALLLVAVTGGGAWLIARGEEENEDVGGQAVAAAEPLAVPAVAPADSETLELAAVAAHGKDVIAVGHDDGGNRQRPIFLVSHDAGTTWRLAAVESGAPLGDRVNGVVHAGFGWLAIGGGPDGPVQWLSEDGDTWTRIPDKSAFRLTDELAGVVRTSAGYLMAGTHGGSLPGDARSRAVLWTSADGRSWRRVEGADTGPLNAGDASRIDSIAARGDVVVLTGSVGRPGSKGGRSAVIWRSVDGGRSWQEVVLPPDLHDKVLAEPMAGVVATADGFLAVGGTRGSYTTLRSVDGEVWQAGPSAQPRIFGQPSQPRRLVRGEGKLVAVASVPGTDSTTDSRIDVLATAGADGQGWAPAQLGSDLQGKQADLRLNAVAAAEGGVVAVGWLEERPTPDIRRRTPVMYRMPYGGPLTRVDLNAVEGLASGTVVPLDGASDGEAVLVGAANGDPAIWVSQNGRSWSRITTSAVPQGPGSQELTAVAKGRLGWLAVGVAWPGRTTAFAVSSPDGKEWQPLPSSELPFPRRSRTDKPFIPTAVTGGDFGYVVVGAVDEGGFTSAAVWYSKDLRLWGESKAAQIAVGGADDLKGVKGVSRAIYDITYNAKGFVAVGAADDPNAPAGKRTRPAVWTSRNSAAWTLRQLPLPAGAEQAELRSVVADGAQFTALGQAVRKGSDGVDVSFPFIAASVDNGANWTVVTLPMPEKAGHDTPATGHALVKTDKGYAVVGSIGRKGSTDAALWGSKLGSDSWLVMPVEGGGLTGPGAQELLAAVPVGAELVALGYSADARTSAPTLWVTQPPS